MLQASVADLERRQAELRAEQGTELLAQLSAAERAELARLGAQLERLQVSLPVLARWKTLLSASPRGGVEGLFHDSLGSTCSAHIPHLFCPTGLGASTCSTRIVALLRRLLAVLRRYCVPLLETMCCALLAAGREGASDTGAAGGDRALHGAGHAAGERPAPPAAGAGGGARLRRRGRRQVPPVACAPRVPASVSWHPFSFFYHPYGQLDVRVALKHALCTDAALGGVSAPFGSPCKHPECSLIFGSAHLVIIKEQNIVRDALATP